ncbi:hypothetical protein NL676_035020 [Syzygium grande]|nr:hypothetical protein NL676_035020 [Syzygium grande]
MDTSSPCLFRLSSLSFLASTPPPTKLRSPTPRSLSSSTYELWYMQKNNEVELSALGTGILQLCSQIFLIFLSIKLVIGLALTPALQYSGMGYLSQ